MFRVHCMIWYSSIASWGNLKDVARMGQNLTSPPQNTQKHTTYASLGLGQNSHAAIVIVLRHAVFFKLYVPSRDTFVFSDGDI